MGLIEIPNSAVLRNARTFLRDTDWAVEPSGTAVVRFHPRWCHMQPWLIAALASWAERARHAGMTIAVENEEKAAYAWRFGLHEYLGFEPATSIREHEEAGRFIPLKRVQGREALSGVLADIAPMLHLSGDPEAAQAIQYIVSEMVRNVLEHARSPHGALVCAQLYSGARTQSPYVSIGIADGGIGVRRSLEHNFPEIVSDADALLTAIRPGTTGAQRGVYGSPENAGAGLFYTRAFGSATDRYFAIASGDAMFRTSIAIRKPTDDGLTFPISPFDGTIVCAELGTYAMFEFSDIFARIGRAFTATTRTQAEEATDRIRFT